MVPRVIDLAVLGQDPRFGGGGRALVRAFLAGATALGRSPELIYEPHPGLEDDPGLSRRVEALHRLRAARKLVPLVREASSLWVVAPAAPAGLAAARSGRRYSCWLATTIDSEWRGRAPGLSRLHRSSARLSLPGLRRMERCVLRGASSVYATSGASRDSIAAALGVDGLTIGVLPIPIDVERFTPQADQAWLDQLERPVITFVGRADDPRKNLPLLMNAFALIRTELPEATLRLIGKPPRPSAVASIAGVEVRGEVDDVPGNLRDSQLFVLPSLQEGFGIVVAEAMASGVPVVTTPSGGPEELVRGSAGGRVTRTFDAEELAREVVTLLRSPERLVACRHAGRAYVVRHHSPMAFGGLLLSALVEADDGD
jgi:glycosyltransferase involved in cell wall biosynthesis